MHPSLIASYPSNFQLGWMIIIMLVVWSQYQKAKELGLIAGVCRACSIKLGVIEAVESEELPLLDDMYGHPSMGDFLERGFQVITL